MLRTFFVKCPAKRPWLAVLALPRSIFRPAMPPASVFPRIYHPMLPTFFVKCPAKRLWLAVLALPRSICCATLRTIFWLRAQTPCLPKDITYIGAGGYAPSELTPMRRGVCATQKKDDLKENGKKRKKTASPRVCAVAPPRDPQETRKNPGNPALPSGTLKNI